MIPDVARLATCNPSQVTLCVSAEFGSRTDGLPSLERSYDFELPNDQVANPETGVVFTRVAKGKPCTFDEVLSTNGRIKKFELSPLEDDKKFFPQDNASLTVREAVLQIYPEREELLAPVSRKPSSAVLQTLNGRVHIGRELPDEVAQGWLEKNGVSGTSAIEIGLTTDRSSQSNAVTSGRRVTSNRTGLCRKSKETKDDRRQPCIDDHIAGRTSAFVSPDSSPKV